jgi:hypothetical protein
MDGEIQTISEDSEKNLVTGNVCYDTGNSLWNTIGNKKGPEGPSKSR